MFKAQKFPKCSSDKCTIQLTSQSYNFQHQKCKKMLCFWCVLELYKKERENIKPKYTNQTRTRLVIKMPCCKNDYENQFSILENFISSGCPFDGVKCQSKFKYQCAAGLSIGRDCLSIFYNNYKYTQSQQRIESMIQKNAKKQCKECNLEKVFVILPKKIKPDQFELQTTLCEQCQLNKAIRQSQKESLSRFCYDCKEKQILEDPKFPQNKNSEFIVKKFSLIFFGEVLKCHYCIYMNLWVNSCKSFQNSKINFRQIMQCLQTVQTLFTDKCLTCGNPPEKGSNAFQFNDSSIQGTGPYKLLVFLCGHCHVMMMNSGKVTKNMRKLQEYLQKTKQEYASINQSRSFKYFKEYASQRVDSYKTMLENENLVEYYEKQYRVKINEKFDKKDLINHHSQDDNRKLVEKKFQKPAQFHEVIKEAPKLLKQVSLPEMSKEQQKKTVLKRQSNETKQRPQQKKPIIESEETKQKSEQLTKTQNNQKKPDINTGSISDKKTYGQLNVNKKSSQQIKNQFVRTKYLRQQKKRILIKKPTSHKIKSENSLNSKTQSINESERFSITDLAESRQSWREESSEFDVTAKQQQKPMQIEEFQHNLHQKGQIFENDTESLDDSEKKEFTQPHNSNQIHKFIEKSYPKEEQCNSMESVEDQLQNQHITKQVSTRLDIKSSFNTTIPELIEKSLGINSPPQNDCHLRNSETQKTYFFTPEQIYQDIFSIKLEEWKFQTSKHVKSPTNCMDFDKKLLQIVSNVQSHFPQILKQIKSQRQKEQIDLSNQKGNQEKRIQRKNESLRFSCNNCFQSQEEFLFLEKYCLRCFNLVILGKLEGEKGKVSKRA